MAVRRGLALILVVGVLAVLAVLGSAFAVLSRLERKAAAQRVNGTRALLLARSGIEDALARLSGGQDCSLGLGVYGGEDWSSDGVLNAGLEEEGQVFNVTPVGTSADTLTCPVRFAMRPSFAKRVNGGDPRLVTVEGRSRGYTGSFRSENAHWALKVEDESGKINVNGGFLDKVDRDNDGIPDCRDVLVTATSNTPRGWNDALQRVLNTLGNQEEVGETNLGTRILQNRPPGGWPSLAALQAGISSTSDLSPWLTTWSWSDEKVIHPNPKNPGKDTLSDTKRWRWPLKLVERGRPPIHLNAAQRPVLKALLTLTGLSYVEPKYPGSRGTSGYLDPILDLLIARREVAPFRTWSDFYAWADSLVDGVTVTGGASTYNCGSNQGTVDLLKANLNPNTQSNKEMPDQLRWLWIDKTDLAQYTTEGSLGPTGAFRISVIGRIVGRDGRLLAKSEALLVSEVFRPFRQTTQKDFVGGRTSLQEYLSLATAPDLTTGASVSDPSWWGPTVPVPGTGLAATTYPCPPPAVTAGRAADFDGFIGLATTETPSADPSPACPILFLHHFDRGWDADHGAAGADLQRKAGPDDTMLQTSVSESVWPDPTLEPNTVYPDGMHPQWFRSPAYAARPNFPPFSGTGNRGAISYWVKRLWLGNNITWKRFWDADFHCARNPWADCHGAQVLISGVDDAWGFIMENISGTGDDYQMILTVPLTTIRERQSHVNQYGTAQYRMPCMRWHLAVSYFDTNEPVGQDLAYYLRGLTVNGDGMGHPQYQVNYETALAEDLFQPGILLSFGRLQGNLNFYDGWMDYRVNHLIDEFALCDFGENGASAVSKVQAWRGNLWMDGRYCKLDATYLSAPLRPGGDSRVNILSAAWTAFLPRENRPEVMSQGDNGGVPDELSLPRNPDPYLQNAGIEVELVDGSETSVPGGGVIQPLSQGGRVGRSLSGFRYRVRFKPNLASPLDDPVLETPIFDDITFYIQSDGGPRFLGWDR